VDSPTEAGALKQSGRTSPLRLSRLLGSLCVTAASTKAWNRLLTDNN
jgi:hypothetical protein